MKKNKTKQNKTNTPHYCESKNVPQGKFGSASVQKLQIDFAKIQPKKPSGNQSCDHQKPPFPHLLLRNSLSMFLTHKMYLTKAVFGVLKQDYAKTTERTWLKLVGRMEKEPKMSWLNVTYTDFRFFFFNHLRDCGALAGLGSTRRALFFESLYFVLEWLDVIFGPPCLKQGRLVLSQV